MLTVSAALAEAAQREPRLASYYDLHRTLNELHEKVKRGLTVSLELKDRESLQERMSQGLPQISFAQLPIDSGRFGQLATAIAKMLVGYDADLAGQALPGDGRAWLCLAQRRFEANQAAGRGQESSREEGRDELAPATLAGLAADQALKPYLTWAAEQVVPHLDLGRWKRAHCPVCGGMPDLALLEKETGARRLVCSRCDSQWPYQRLGCPYCATTDYAKIVYYPSDDQVYRLYVCQVCRRYLKTIDLRNVPGQFLLPVERVLTAGMDVAAREQGYH